MNLFEMLDDAPVTLVLGAGASMDYGLPSWGQLKSQLITIASKNHSDLNISKNVADFWVRELSDLDGSTTLDAVAGRTESNAHYSAFQKMTAFALLQCEKRAAIETNDHWIESFSGACVSYLNDTRTTNDRKSYLQRMKNLNSISVVSLNYDRVFQFKLMERMTATLSKLTFSRQKERLLGWPRPELSFTMIQPHGALGLVKGTSNGGKSILTRELSKLGQPPFYLYWSAYSSYEHLKNLIDFGNTEQLLKICSMNGIDGDANLNIIAVDDLIDGADVSNYEVANALFSERNIISIGLSPLGFNNSQLSFSEAKTVTLTNSKLEVEKFSSQQLPDIEKVTFWTEGKFASNLMDELIPDIG